MEGLVLIEVVNRAVMSITNRVQGTLPYRRKFSLEFKFRYFVHGKLAEFKSRLNFIFRNHSMIACFTEILKSLFDNIKFREFDQSEPGC